MGELVSIETMCEVFNCHANRFTSGWRQRVRHIETSQPTTRTVIEFHFNYKLSLVPF